MIIIDDETEDMAALHERGYRDTPAAFSSPEPDASELNLPVPDPIPDPIPDPSPDQPEGLPVTLQPKKKK